MHKNIYCIIIIKIRLDNPLDISIRKLIFIINLTLFFSIVFLHKLRIIDITNINIKTIKKREKKEGKNSETIDKKNTSHERIDGNKLNEITSTYTLAGVYQQVKDRYYRV